MSRPAVDPLSVPCPVCTSLAADALERALRACAARAVEDCQEIVRRGLTLVDCDAEREIAEALIQAAIAAGKGAL